MTVATLKPAGLTTVAALIVCACVGCGDSGDTSKLWGRNLTSLGDDDYAVVEYWHLGCFSQEAYVFRFSGKPDFVVQATQILPLSPDESKESVPLGELRVSADDLRSLDRFISVVRSTDVDECTDREFIEIEWFRNHRSVGAEKLEGHVCGEDGRSLDLGLGDLAARAREKAPRNIGREVIDGHG